MKKIKYALTNTIKANIFVVLISLIMTSLVLVFELYIPYLVQEIIDKGIGTSDLNVVKRLVIFLIIIYIFKSIFSFYSDYSFNKLSYKLIEKIYIQAIDNFLNKSYKFFHKYENGDLIERLNEIWDIKELITIEFFHTFLSLLSAVAALILLLRINIIIGLIIVVVSIAYIIFFKVYTWKVRSKAENVLTESSNLTIKITEVIEGFKEIINNKIESFISDSFLKVVKNKIQVERLLIFYTRSRQELMTLFLMLVDVLVIYISSKSIISHELTIGNYFLITSYVSKTISPISQATSFFTNLNMIKISISRIDIFLSNDMLVNDNTGLAPEKIESIVVKDLNYSYDDSGLVLKNLSFNINQGLTLIKGDNGSGKSTLLNIIAGNISNYTGLFLVNTHEASSIILRKKSICVYQNPFVFNLSIKKNIILNKKFDENKYNKLLRKLQMNRIIDNERLLSDDPIHDNGATLSGGQIKIIAIARALYHDYPIVILDEPFANLDTYCELLLFEIISKLKNEKILIIAEHGNTLDNICDNSINVD